MAIEVNEMPQRDGELAFDPQRGWVRSYRRTWEVLTSSSAVEAIEVMGAIPVVHGNTYAVNGKTDRFSFVQSIRARCESEDGLTWTVEAEYGPFDPTTKPENPLDEPPEVGGDYAQFERVVDVDRNGTHVVNSAGEPFDPGVVVDDTRPVLQVTRNEQTFSLAKAYQYRDTVNASDWLGAPAKSVKASPVKFRRQWHPVCGYYFSVAYEFEFNPDGWTRKVLDAGLRKISLVTGKLLTIKDAEGVPVSSPVPLDGSGYPINARTGQVALEFEIYNAIDFSTAFGLDGVLGQDIFA